MFAKENLAQTLACKKSGLRALELHFFQLLPALALEFSFGKRSFAREFVDEAKQWFGKFAQARERNRARVLACVGREISAKPPQVFFDLPARALRSSGANHRCGHVRKAGSKMRN